MKRGVASAVIFIALVTASCSQGKPGKEVTPTQATRTPLAVPTADAAQRTSIDEGGDDEAITTFGGTGYTWNDGLNVRVSTPKPFKPSTNAAYRSKDRQFSIVTLTITNNTGKMVDVGQFMTSATTGSREAQEIYDVENELTQAPTTKLLTGRVKEYRVAYGVDAGQEFVLQVTPSFDHGQAIFTR